MKSMFTFLVLIFSSSLIFRQVYVKWDAAGTNDGTSWLHAFTSLQTALNTASPGYQLWIASGKYTHTGPNPDSTNSLYQNQLTSWWISILFGIQQILVLNR